MHGLKFFSNEVIFFDCVFVHIGVHLFDSIHY